MKRKFKSITVRYKKSGRVFRVFKNVLVLGRWMFRGRHKKCRRDYLRLVRSLHLTHTLDIRASRAYVSWLLGTSRIRPRC